MGSTYKVLKQITRLIVPFAFESYDRAIFQMNPVYWNEENDYHFNRLLPKINHSISGKKFLLNSNGRNHYQLPHNYNSIMQFEAGKREKFDLSINDIEIFLFNTNVGFLIYDIHYPRDIDIESLIQANYYATKLHVSNYLIKFRKNISQHESEEKILHLGDLTEHLLSELEITSYFDGFNKSVHMALLFNSAIVEQIQDTNIVKEYLVKMRRSYKEDQQLSSQENEAESLCLFENSYWGVSLEGLANLVSLTDNEATNKFFMSAYFAKARTTYFYIYLFLLHHRYALLNFSLLASYIPSMIKEDIERANETFAFLNEKMGMLSQTAVAQEMTNNTHQSKLYDLIKANLRQTELISSLTDQVNSSSTLLHMHTAKENDAKTNFQSVIVIWSLVFVFVSTVADMLSILNIIFNGKTIAEWGALEYIISSIALLILLALVDTAFKKASSYLNSQK